MLCGVIFVRNNFQASQMAGAKKGTPRNRLNYQLAPGVMRFSAARMFHKRGVAFTKKAETPKKPRVAEEQYIVKKIGGAKNGGERKVLKNKSPALLSADPALDKKVKPVRKTKKVSLRKSITPGTILIILAGRHKGKRVVFLKQLEKTGLLLVTGPHKLNNVPLRRIAQAFVIATSSKIDISGVKIPDNLNDQYYKRTVAKAQKKGEQANLFASGREQYKVTDQRKADQKLVDKAVLEAIKKNPDGKILKGYFSSRFFLGKGQLPHKMLF